jgi:hypothetical protein
MKKAIIVFVLAAMVPGTTALWLLSSADIKPSEIVGLGIIVLVVGFAICWLIFNFRGVRNE